MEHQDLPSTSSREQQLVGALYCLSLFAALIGLFL